MQFVGVNLVFTLFFARLAKGEHEVRPCGIPNEQTFASSV